MAEVGVAAEAVEEEVVVTLVVAGLLDPGSGKGMIRSTELIRCSRGTTMSWA